MLSRKKWRDTEARPKMAGEMGRPKKSKEGQPTTLSFQAEADLIGDLDAEVEHLSSELGVKLSRTQVVKKLLREALSARTERRKK